MHLIVEALLDGVCYVQQVGLQLRLDELVHGDRASLSLSLSRSLSLSLSLSPSLYLYLSVSTIKYLKLFVPMLFYSTET